MERTVSIEQKDYPQIVIEDKSEDEPISSSEFKQDDEQFQQLNITATQIRHALRPLLLDEDNYKEILDEEVTEADYEIIKKIQDEFKRGFNLVLKGRLSFQVRFNLYKLVMNLEERLPSAYKLFWGGFLGLYCINKLLKSLDHKDTPMENSSEDAYTLLEQAKESGIYDELKEAIEKEEYGKSEIEPALPEKEYSSLGGYIKDLRINYNGKLTQAELAELAETSRSYIADVETNRRSPQASTLDKLSEALNGDRDYMYMLADYWPPTLPKTKSNLELLKKYATVSPEEYLRKMESQKSFGDYIREKRKEKGWTQEDLAKRTKLISRAYMADLELERATPTVPVFKALLEALEENPGVLLSLKYPQYRRSNR